MPPEIAFLEGDATSWLSEGVFADIDEGGRNDRSGDEETCPDPECGAKAMNLAIDPYCFAEGGVSLCKGGSRGDSDCVQQCSTE